MAGPDSKRLYLSIVAQNLDNIKSERAYWNKNFISLTPSGAGTKYTTLQAAMMLKKMQVVKYLAKHPSIDISVKATDGRTTLMIAAQSSMPVPILQKILEKYDLRTLNECDSLGKTALDLAEPGSETYEFLESVGCQTKAARDACLQGFFVSAGKAVHQRVRRKGEGGEGKSRSCPTGGSDRHQSSSDDQSRSRSEEKKDAGGSYSEADVEGLSSTERQRFGKGDGSPSETGGPEEEDGEDVNLDEESPWQLFKDPHDLVRVLQNYLDAWGDEGEEGELCQEWVTYMKKKIKKNGASEAVEKWNKLVISMYGEENVFYYERRGDKDEFDDKGAETPGTDPDMMKRTDESSGRESSATGGGGSGTKRHGNNKTSKSSASVDKQHRRQRDDDGGQGEKEGGSYQSGDVAGGVAPVENSMTVPESLRGFFNPQPASTEDSEDPPPQKERAEGDKRRTLGVWLDKSDARERFAEVLPKGGGIADSRRRHKKDKG